MSLVLVTLTEVMSPATATQAVPGTQGGGGGVSSWLTGGTLKWARSVADWQVALVGGATPCGPPYSRSKVKHGAVEVVGKTLAVVDTEAGRKAYTENPQNFKNRNLTEKLIIFSCQDIFPKINQFFMQ